MAGVADSVGTDADNCDDSVTMDGVPFSFAGMLAGAGDPDLSSTAPIDDGAIGFGAISLGYLGSDGTSADNRGADNVASGDVPVGFGAILVGAGDPDCPDASPVDDVLDNCRAMLGKATGLTGFP